MSRLLQKLLTALKVSLARSPSGSSVVSGPTVFRKRQVAGSSTRSRVHLRLVSDGTKVGTDAKFAALIGASFSSVVVAGFASPAVGQSDEACAFVMQLRSPYTVERILEQFPNDPCIPVMLTKISPELLSRVKAAKILALPQSQLRLIPQEILERVGGKPAATRSAPKTRTTTYTENTQTSTGTSSGSQY